MGVEGGHRHMVGGDRECREVGGTDIWWGETVGVERWGAQTYGPGRQ